MPTTALNTYSEDVLIPMYPDIPHPELPIKLPNSVTYAKGTVLGPVTASPGTYKAYATGNVDGSETATCILKYPIATDASGNHFIGTSTAASNFGESRKDCPAYFGGAFKTAEFPSSGAGSLDAAGLADLQGIILHGTLADGVIKF
jgi:hypothetical protein